ncbi:hypothetical protein C8R44DRAFT_947505, partial [Mycena epipterygia]
LYIPQSQEDTAITLITNELGFSVSDSNKPPYENNTHIQTVHWLNKGEKKINIIVVKGENTILAIFEFHSTIVMNFLSAHGLYCAYPTLTLHKLTTPNLPIMIREIGLSGRCDACFEKYRRRGISYETDARIFPGHTTHTCYIDGECPSTVRTTSDSRGLYMELTAFSGLIAGGVANQ